MVQPAEETIRVEVEPQNSEVRIPITANTSVKDVLDRIQQACRENPDIDLGIWARQRVGSDTPTWRLFRKGQNNQVLAPAQRIIELEPPVGADEEFVFDVEPVVG